MPADPNRIRDIFLAASELPASDLPAYLANACGGNAELLAAVERLLAAHDRPARVLEPASRHDGAGTATFDPKVTTRALGPRLTDAPGLVLAGKYKMIEQIGEGGMGTVWMAQQTEPVKRL